MEVRVEYEDLTEWDRQLLLNGCGPNSIQAVPELVFTMACNRHDFDYIVGGPRDLPNGDSSYRMRAEESFERRLYAAAAQTSWYVCWWYYWAAWVYARATKNFGQQFFVYRPDGAVVDLMLLRREQIEYENERGKSRPCAMVMSLRKSRGESPSA